ncbi:hypothetical protein CUMW_213480 [Citrus unshiu]|uniref:Uncharacterized protein n=1 Tax=Citrus unshiu TaxID=55188 RepID=A0A2H5QCB1_CITUN|nr:hypothetical protein CUMW_213480 [Citrus unshiu]
MSSNKLEGPIPLTIGDLTNLIYLDLSLNQLSGPIPSTFGHLTLLKFLNLNSNKLNGSIPSELMNCFSLQSLILSNNSLTGRIPSEIRNLSYLHELDLSLNFISGMTPPQHFKQKHSIRDRLLTYVNHQFNRLSGQIPMTIGGLSKLSGSVPSEIGNCSGLLNVTLSNNSLDGTIPLEMGKIIFLEYLDLSYNNIPGTVPEFINRIMPADLVPMINFSISPTPSPASPQQEPNKVMILLISIIFPIAAFVAFLAHGTLFLLRRKNKRAELTSGEIKSQDRDAFSIWNCDGRIAFEEIIRATEDLISDIALELDVTAAFTKHGCLVAEYGSEQGRSAFFKSFQNEAHVFNNILLNSEFEAFFGNFGVARLLNSDSSNRTLIAGTYRYIAPDQRISPPKKQKIVQDIALASIVALACLQSKPNKSPLENKNKK